MIGFKRLSLAIVTCLCLRIISASLSASPDLLLVPRDAPAQTVPLRLWANPRQAALRPRKRDLHQSVLMAALEPHFDPIWMSPSRPHRPPTDISRTRKSVNELNRLASSLGLSDTVKDWLVSRGTCPVAYTWRDLGPDFWPRWVRMAVCRRPQLGTCSWPPGMSCVSGPPKHLHVLRWHCRLRKNAAKRKRKGSGKMVQGDENNVWSGGDATSGSTVATSSSPLSSSSSSTANVRNGPSKKKGRRKRYKCLWVKVPYPVPEDCVCACA